MDKFPLLWEGKALGELIVEQEALYTWFTVRCRLPGEGIWCAWAVGDRGELRLGVVEPQNGIRRRFSRQMTAPLGKLLRGELRPAGERAAETWTAAPEPDRLFHTPWLRRRLRWLLPLLRPPPPPLPPLLPPPPLRLWPPARPR